MDEYINFHAHSHYSPLDGVATPDDYARRAKEIGMSMLATTEHGTLAGHREFQRVAKDNNLAPALGLEAYYAETDRFDRQAPGKRTDGFGMYSHLILIAKDDTGLHNLQELSRLAWSEGYYFKPRIDWELLDEYGDGLVVLSGCMGSALGKAILDRDDQEYARNLAARFKERFVDDYYIELQSHNPKQLNHTLLELADKLGISPVSTEDCHHATPMQKELQEAFLILNTHPTKIKSPDLEYMAKLDLLDKFDYLYPDRKMTFEHLDIYLAEYTHRLAQYQEQGIDRLDLFANTREIASKIAGYKYEEGLSTLPVLHEDSAAELERQTWDGLRRLGMIDNPDAIARAKRELGVINGKGFPNYILMVGDAIQWAKKQGIRVGPGRGSAASSLVCYALGITNVNPLRFDLLFERFIDPDRPDMPDIDVDIADDRREEVIEYVRGKYGHVGRITTITYYKGKSALKDSARALGVPYAESNAALKAVDGFAEEEILAQYKKLPELKEFRLKYPDVIRIAEQLDGLIKGYGLHAAGVIVANRPIAEIATVETRKVTGQDRRAEVVGLDYREAEKLGLIKQDWLGLKTLSIIDLACKLIKERHARIIDVDTLPHDPNVYSMLEAGHTLGVFQCEAQPYTKLLMKMGCKNFDDLAASNALIRPGAWNAIGEDYIAKKNGRAKNKSIHPDVDHFMNSTYNEVLFQEQLMLLCIDLAGLTMADASKVRKGVGKKIPEIIAEYKDRFIEGASKKVSELQAERLWNSFEASGAYAFNKAHSVAYSLLSYQTAWLKYHYPLEFMCALLMRETDNDFVTEYMLECKRLGIKILLPHVNKSGVFYTIEERAIRIGLSGVKYISEKLANRIIAHRPFENYAQLEAKVKEKGSGLNSRMLASLNLIGGATFADNPRRGDEKQYYYEYLGIPAFEHSLVTSRMRESMSTLSEFTEKGAFVIMAMVKKIKRGDGWARVDMVDSTGSAGAFDDQDTTIQKGSMYIMLIADNRIMRAINVDELVDFQEDPLIDWIRRPYLRDLTGEFRRVMYYAERTTKNDKRIANVVVSDADKNLYSYLVFSNTIDKVSKFLSPGATRVIETNNYKGTEHISNVY